MKYKFPFGQIPLFTLYLGLSGLGGLSMKLLLVALEIGTTGIFFNKGEDSEAQQTKNNSSIN